MTSTKSNKSILRSRKAMKALLAEIKFQTGELFNHDHRKNIILACFIQFGLTCSYYTLMLWFPELFNRYEKFEHLHPGWTHFVVLVNSFRLYIYYLIIFMSLVRTSIPSNFIYF
ncbi:uncharacterized protein LOC103508009 [Diaphorina citri]|uniref:Uncharacterized protein LOC103508009 n=1 Tax=Diaphorina citri TaxID=121845 RepID=A0A3Q0IVW9_DIACI|nr:uncharacterized protein LOC103508009 [Diaphorina citri]